MKRSSFLKTVVAILVVLFYKIDVCEAQTPFVNYRVEYSQQAYTNLSNPSYVFFSSEMWLDSSYKMNYWDAKLNGIFDFNINNEKLNHFVYGISSFDISFLGDSSSFHTRPVAANTKEFSNVIPYQTKVSASIDSSTAERIFKIEFKQIGLTDSTWQTKGFLNMQYWYYANGDFEVRYGECDIPTELWTVKKPITSGEGNYKIQFSLSNLGSYNIFLYGAYNNPSVYSSSLIKLTSEYRKLDSLMRDSALSQVPPSGTVYRFTTRGVGIEELKRNTLKNISIFPNPSEGVFVLNGLLSHNKYTVSICDGTGKTVFTTIAFQNYKELNLQGLENGLYYLIISTDEETITKKIIIAH